MAGARFMSWHRAGPLAIAAIAWGLLPGCGDGNNSASGGGGSGTTTTTTTSSMGGTGGTGGATGGGGAQSEPEVTPLANGRVIDSTPSSGGDVVYYTASTDDGPGVLSVSGEGGNPKVVFVGDPFVAPIGITISGDDATLFVADPGAENKPEDPTTALGAVFTVASSGGTPTAMSGTFGFKPRGVDMADLDGEETLFFTGVDPSSGTPGVFRVIAGGGTPKAIVTGAPFVDPSGIAVGKTQTFVADTGADSAEGVSTVGSIVVIENDAAQTFVSGLGLGYPAGVALSADEKTLYVSGVDPDTGFDVVYIVDVATKMVTPYSGGDVGKNRDAGGLHRARKTDVFSWADLTAGGSGTVYKVTFK